MKPFNFVETKMVERNFYKRYVQVRLRRVVMLIAFTVIISAFTIGMRTVYAKQVNCIKSELAGMDTRCAKAREQLTAASKISIENKWRDSLDTSSKRVLGMTNSILRCTPDDVWLSRVQNMDKSPDVVVEGCAATFASLSRLIGSLRETRSFETVHLDSTRAVSATSAEPVEFSIRLKLRDRSATTPETQSTLTPLRVPSLGGTN